MINGTIVDEAHNKKEYERDGFVFETSFQAPDCLNISLGINVTTAKLNETSLKCKASHRGNDDNVNSTIVTLTIAGKNVKISTLSI